MTISYGTNFEIATKHQNLRNIFFIHIISDFNFSPKVIVVQIDGTNTLVQYNK